jgi:hypothetical protein
MEANPRSLEHRRYLGDGVYVGFDGARIVLSAENGVTTREIVLEPDVWLALVNWVDGLVGAAVVDWVVALDNEADE